MQFIVRDCIRCGVRKIRLNVVGFSRLDLHNWEVAAECADCNRISVWSIHYHSPQSSPAIKGNLESQPGSALADTPARIATTAVEMSPHIPARIAYLFREANECRQMGWYDAAGAMFRKALDVATKHIYATDPRLIEKVPAQALRVRIKSLGEMNILDQDIVELADVAALDGNDAAHDVDPYTKDEAEALEELTLDLLDRLFVRPAKIAAVKAKQIAAGVRPA